MALRMVVTNEARSAPLASGPSASASGRGGRSRNYDGRERHRYGKVAFGEGGSIDAYYRAFNAQTRFRRMLCGAVRLTAVGEPYRVGVCHCLACRKHHGALFFAAAIFPEDAVQIEGETRSYRGRHFCPSCGSSVFAKFIDEIEVNLGTLDDPSRKDAPTFRSRTPLFTRPAG